MKLFDRAAKWLINRTIKREPDFTIGGIIPMVHRWWIIPRNRILNLYLHQFVRDNEPELHDHPWLFNISIILTEPGYREITDKNVIYQRNKGKIVFRFGKNPHRVEISKPMFSLFITGPIVRKWGFYCPKKWVDWKIYNKNEGCPE